MKKLALFFILTANAISINCFAQNRSTIPAKVKTENMQSPAVNISNNNNDDLAVVSYHVEERINVTLGSNITTYNVSNKNLINTNDLGGTNVRIVTPKYGKAKAETVKEPSKTSVDVKNKDAKTTKVETVVAEIKDRTVNINIANTYERVLDKGYKSIDMLKSVGNSRFFDGDLITAAKWYSQLFTMTTDLEPVYFYRYAESLKAIGEIENSKRMMALFESKNSEK